MALEYAIALYPLVLIFICMVKLHDTWNQSNTDNTEAHGMALCQT